MNFSLKKRNFIYIYDIQSSQYMTNGKYFIKVLIYEKLQITFNIIDKFT